MRTVIAGSIGLVVMLTVANAAAAQAPSEDVSSRLTAVLPAEVAQHVLSVIRDARSEQLPASAVENRSLKFAARGVPPNDIARAADDQLIRMRDARGLLRSGRARPATGDEIEAGAEALREGVDGSAVSTLAKSAPSGRSLTVPLYVIGSLVSRGLPSDQALARVQSKLAARATDADIQKDGQDVADAHRGNNNGRHVGERSGAEGNAGHGGGPPAGVPGNAGRKGRPPNAGGPGTPGKPGGKGHP